MMDPAGESQSEALRLDFDRRLMLQFRGSVITSDAGMLPYRELDDAVGLTDTGAETLADARTGKITGWVQLASAYSRNSPTRCGRRQPAAALMDRQKDRPGSQRRPRPPCVASKGRRSTSWTRPAASRSRTGASTNACTSTDIRP